MIYGTSGIIVLIYVLMYGAYEWSMARPVLLIYVLMYGAYEWSMARPVLLRGFIHKIWVHVHVYWWHRRVFLAWDGMVAASADMDITPR